MNWTKKTNSYGFSVWASSISGVEVLVMEMVQGRTFNVYIMTESARLNKKLVESFKTASTPEEAMAEVEAKLPYLKKVLA